MTDGPVLELNSISKRFGPVTACDRVDLAVSPGEIVGLLGQNGAGKSTLMKIVLGLVPPDAGEVLVGGEAQTIADPTHAASLGIAMVHQHFSVIDALTVWENVHLGAGGRLDPRRLRAEVAELSAAYDLVIDPDARVGDLNVSQRQRLEIIKCLRRDPALIILDEPTSVLTLAESRRLFEVLRRMVADRRRAVVLISHKLDEILHATDRVVIMRDGRVVTEKPTSDADAAGLARAMVGREVSLRTEASALGILGELTAAGADDPGAEARRGDGADGADGAMASDPAEQGNGVDAAGTGDPAHAGRVVLQVRGATAVGADGRPLLDGLDLELRSGEILGVAGVEGNGQVALTDLLSSLLELDGGEVTVAGEAVAAGVPGAMGRAGVAVIPEDRHASGCVPDLTVAENLILTNTAGVSRWGMLNKSRMTRLAGELIDRFEIATPSPDIPLRLLSGGNQQKVVLARELSGAPKVLVASQPTRGLDVGAIEYMSEQLRAAADEGVAVLLISTELEEILDLADRVTVIFRGRLSRGLPRRTVDPEQLGLMMGGHAA